MTASTADHRLALEGEDGAEDAVGGRVLRPHVHREALVAPVPHLDDLARFGSLCRLAYRISIVARANAWRSRAVTVHRRGGRRD